MKAAVPCYTFLYNHASESMRAKIDQREQQVIAAEAAKPSGDKSRGITTPMGVATYNNIRIKDMLPTQEQLKERMELLQKEIRATKRLMKKSSE